jgi:1-acyl-sn-glycerol-3-phosphate acyltransferase
MTPTQLLYDAGKQAIRTYSGGLLNMDVEWHAPLPDGPVIIAPNHPTTVDPFVMLGLLPRRTRILVTESAFKVPVFGRYLRQTGHICVGHSSGRTAFDQARELLTNGHTLTVFPEGALSQADGSLQRARTGVARLALLTGAAIVPVGIGLDRSRVRHLDTQIDDQVETARLYLRGPYAVTVGRPLHLNGDVNDWPHVRALAAALMTQIAALAQESMRRLAPPITAQPQPVFAPLNG